MTNPLKRTLGVCYYPEHWPEERWAIDAAQMVETGLTWVRIGEFAWQRIEPAKGDIRWDWLDRAIETLGKAGLRVVLGTPTATPPRWMYDLYPDIYFRPRDGQPCKFGSRRQYCFSHAGYRDECARITTLLADRYGQNPHVAAWQTDNEYSCHDTTLSYSIHARDAFRLWLAERYETIDNLNAAWGNVFWSMDYDSFDQIDLPEGVVAQVNPTHLLDFKRFSSDQVVSFNRIQTDILHAKSSAPIAHNYMGAITDFDHYATGADLEIASWDSYPLGFLEDRILADEDWKASFAHQGDPDFQAFHHDLYRTVGRGRWWIMEQQPGPVNWAPHNPAPLPGMARLWAWEAFAHGAEAVCYFRWRQAPFAQEQMHSGLLRVDAEPAPALAEAAQVARELAALPDVEPTAAPVALVFDYAAQWSWESLPQGADMNYFELVFDTYKALRRAGLSIDIIPPDTANLSPYKLVLAPGAEMLRPEFTTAITGTDAQIVLGPRTNCKTRDLHVPTPLPPAIKGLDCTVTRVETLRPNTPIALTGGGHIRGWFEHLDTSAEITQTTQTGAPAMIRAGNLHYLAGWPDADGFDQIIAALCNVAGIATIPLQPDGLRIRDAGQTRFVFNYTAQAQNYREIEIAPADVHWHPIS